MKPCPRCLLNESDQAELHAVITEYIKNIPPENRTPPAEYNKRLSICKDCDRLLSGMCVLCGCYIELRAARANQRCVESETRWA
jgi:hypothetical protein